MASSGGIVGTETQQTLVSPDNLQAQRSGTAAPGRRNKINMEAYQAYYNTNESQSNATQVIQPKAPAKASAVPVPP